MRVLVVSNSLISDLPPARNVVNALLRKGHQVTFVTKDGDCRHIELHHNLKYIRISEVDKHSPFAVILYFKHRYQLRKIVKEEMNSNDVLWTTTDKTVRELGRLVYKYKHIMQLPELIEDLPLIPGQSFLKCNISKYGRAAYHVVVPEYNRAHIQKAWWNLKEVPKVLPNKACIKKEEYTDIPKEFEGLVEKIKEEKRKIIIYQGILGKDRDLELYASAIDEMKNDYVFLVMGRPVDGFDIEKFRDRHNVIIIPFIDPPNHLYITSFAHIGVLPYKPQKVAHLSILNAVFCAPNKIYEYAAFGIPMIGSDVPGINRFFSIYECGITLDEGDSQIVIDAINKIEDDYMTFSNNSFNFYLSDDFDSDVESILL